MKKPEEFEHTQRQDREKRLRETELEREHSSTIASLRALDEVPERQVASTASGRQAFLTAARQMRQAVSPRPKSRHMGWTKIFKKERSPMFTLARIILIAAFALGGTGVTAFAAQESLPDQALYPVKTWIEDLRLGLVKDPQADFNLLFGFVEERIAEMEALVEGGMPIPSQVATRLNLHLQMMARAAADLDDPALLKAMEQVRQRSQLQVQRLEQLRQLAPQDSPALGQATQAMHTIRNTAEGALEDPLTFRQHQGVNRPEEAPDFPENEAPNGAGEGPMNGGGQGPGEPQGPNQKGGG